MKNPVSFTLKSKGGLLNVLSTVVHIHNPNTGAFLPFNAIWDTGATGTAITSNVVKSLGLIPTGGKNVSTANGIIYQNTHIINVGIPNLAIIQGLVATDLGSLAGGCDVLIGMDIINLGDFSITNHNGITCLSFRMPSSHEIDYVTHPTLKVQKTASTGSNYTPPKKKRKKR